ncbi:MAG: hypothetical protein LBU51_01930, partial [Bacteroidales bacterium]|nr:hypothetical protein [Bacteroidales bacterium]
IWQKNIELALGFGISTQTVSKWRNRSSLKNLSSRPHTIHHGLSAICIIYIKYMKLKLLIMLLIS